MALNFTTEFKNLAVYGKAIAQIEAITNISAQDRIDSVNAIRLAAQRYFVRKVSSDIGQPNLTLDRARAEFMRQMIADAGPATINAPASSAVVTSVLLLGSGGAGALVSSRDRNYQVTRLYRNFTYENRCVRAPIPGKNYTAAWEFRSTPLEDPAGPNYAYGLGVNLHFDWLASAQLDGYVNCPANTNMLRNGGMERFSIAANLPDHWENVNSSTAGSLVYEISTPHIGTKAIRFVGNGSHKHFFRQQIGAAGTVTNGTTARLKAKTFYGMKVHMRRYATGAITGVFRLSIQDSGGSVVTNASVSQNMNAMSTTYALVNFTFQTPVLLNSSAYYACLEFTTELGNTHEVYADECMLFELTEAPGLGWIGYYETPNASEITEFSSTAYSISTPGVLYALLDRLLDFSASGYSPPTDAGGTETIADSLSVTCP